MPNINLLPWREERRQEKQKEFFALVGAVLLAGLIIVFGWDRWVNGRIDWQNSRNSLLQTEIATLDVKIKEINELKLRKQQMIERMEVILALQGNRPVIVRIYDEFVRATPKGVYFTEMKKQAENISLVGYAESNSRISTLMRQLDNAEMFKEPNLTKVEADDILGDQGSRFELQVKVASQIDNKEEV
jgi:type IV pilus assembly protein PilN